MQFYASCSTVVLRNVLREDGEAREAVCVSCMEASHGKASNHWVQCSLSVRVGKYST